MQVGDLVREKTNWNRPCSTGLVLKTRHGWSANSKPGAEEYLVHFFDDKDQCWMSPNFLETINASR